MSISTKDNKKKVLKIAFYKNEIIPFNTVESYSSQSKSKAAILK